MYSHENRLRAAIRWALYVTALTASVSVPFAAFAAEQPQSKPQTTALEEVVVTGTLIRGIAPASASVVSVGREEAAATGALTTPQLLANIPQITGFNTTPVVIGTNGVQQNVNPVTLRGLPGAGGAGGGASTLQLMDGHRMVGAGVRSTVPDPDFLPPSAIERVEAVPDGGSSIYGADAVGGVLNLITRKRFDGVQFDGHFGIADQYQQYDAGLTAGRDWGSGSAFVAYNHLEHDSIYGRDRDYIKYINWATGQGAEPNCAGNVTLTSNGSRYIVSGTTLVPGRNFCDRSGDRTFYPEEDRDSVFASYLQALGDNMTFDVKGYYMLRKNVSDEGPRSSAASVPGTLARTPQGLTPPNATQSVQVVFTPFGAHSLDEAELETWGVTPSLTINLPNDWQVRTMLNYGRTVTTVANPAINAVALGIAAATGQFNPYDLASPVNTPAVFSSIGDYELYGRSINELGNARAIFDGPLLTLPGGEVRGAFGVEYLYEAYEARIGNSVPGQEEATLTLFPSNRHTEAAFAEVNIPIVGADNHVPFVHSATLSLSARYDDYSDFGNTTNPTIGFNYEPVEWISFRGRWGTSFQAPSLGDSAAADNNILILPSSIIANPFVPAPGTKPNELIYQGGLPGIKPQEADTWSAGFTISPPAVPGLTLTGTYYNIKFEGVVSIPPVFIPSQFFTQFTSKFVMFPTNQEVIDFINAAPNSAQNLAALNGRGGPGTVYLMIDSRRGNLGDANVSGLDLGARYSRQVSFGSIFTSLNGTYRLKNDQSPNAGAPLVSQIKTASRLRYTWSVGANIGEHLRGQATLLYNDGFDITPSVTNNFQTTISPYQTINLYAQYDVKGTGLTDNLTFSLSVNNVADHDPPLYQGLFANSTYGYGNGGTLGRLFQLGVSKKF